MEKKIKETAASFFIPSLVLVIVIVISFTGWRYVSSLIVVHSVEESQRASLAVKNLITDRFSSYLVGLHGLSTLFTGDSVSTRDDFHRYADALRLEESYPGFRSVAFLKYIKAADKQKFIDDTRNELGSYKADEHFASHAAHEKERLQDAGIGPSDMYPRQAAQFDIYPPGERAEYIIAQYVEPFEGREKALGFDYLMDAQRTPAIELARDTGEPTMTPRIILITNQEPGFLIFVPVYKNGEIPTTIAERRASFIGATIAVFIIDDFFNQILTLSDAFQNADMSIYDTTYVASLSDSNLWFKSANAYPSPIMQSPNMHTSTVGIFGRKFTIQFYGRPEMASYEQYIPEGILVGGIILGFLLFGLLYSYSTASARAMELAEEMTDEIREQTTILKKINSQLSKEILERERSEEVLRARTAELESLNKLMIGRELKMAELKKQIKNSQGKNTTGSSKKNI